MRLWAIVPAAGSGTRMGLGFNKALAPLAGRPMLVRTLEAIATWPTVAGVVVVHAVDEQPTLQGVLAEADWPWPLVWAIGGATRADSVRSGMLAALDAGADWLAVHDAARPLASGALVAAVLARALEVGAAIPGCPVVDTVKRLRPGTDMVATTVPREDLWQVQTPQIVRADLLRQAYAKAEGLAFAPTDEASLLEFAGHGVAVVPGDPANLKVTGPADMARVVDLGVSLGRWSTPPDSGPIP